MNFFAKKALSKKMSVNLLPCEQSLETSFGSEDFNTENNTSEVDIRSTKSSDVKVFNKMLKQPESTRNTKLALNGQQEKRGSSKSTGYKFEEDCYQKSTNLRKACNSFDNLCADLSDLSVESRSEEKIINSSKSE